jgi:diacylglycerol kinase family enzyme
MYYYIYESAKSSADRKIQEKIKYLITSIGISGEQVTPNPARTIDELVDIGVTKGYSTIVAVGSDIFANKIASSILNQQKDESQKIVFGFLPKNPQESVLAKTLGLNSLEQAVTALRYRKLSDLSIALLMPNKFFLIPLVIKDDKAFNLNIKLPHLTAESTASQIDISPVIEVMWNDQSSSNGMLSNFLNKIFQNNKADHPKSLLKTHSLDLKTEPSLPVLLGDEVIARTPIRVKALPNYLHIIVNRGSVTEEGKGDANT